MLDENRVRETLSNPASQEPFPSMPPEYLPPHVQPGRVEMCIGKYRSCSGYTSVRAMCEAEAIVLCKHLEADQAHQAVKTMSTKPSALRSRQNHQTQC